MLQTGGTGSEYVIKVLSQDNPLQIKLPVIPGNMQSQSVTVITIDAFTFNCDKKYVAVPPATDNVTDYAQFINVQSDAVRLIFNNGTGCFNETGRQTKMLEIATDSIVVTTNTYMQKKWDLQGGTDPYIWTFGHDLQLGFIDIDDNPINFKLLNTFYSLIVKVNII